VTVRYERDGPVAVIVIDRPPLNAYDRRLEADLQRAWATAGRDDARVVVLRAEGEHFCAGADMASTRGEQEEVDSGPLVAPWDELELIRRLPKPTIAAVQGGCVGGGQRFVFPCDLVFCSTDAFFRDPLAGLAGTGGIQAPLHTWMYGPRLAKEMIFSGMRLPAERLYQMGLVNRLYPRERLAEEAIAFAREVALVEPRALREAKRSVNMTMDLMGQHLVRSRFEDLMDR
jgi:enoyl-CoA hydratase